MEDQSYTLVARDNPCILALSLNTFTRYTGSCVATIQQHHKMQWIRSFRTVPISWNLVKNWVRYEQIIPGVLGAYMHLLFLNPGTIRTLRGACGCTRLTWSTLPHQNNVCHQRSRSLGSIFASQVHPVLIHLLIRKTIGRHFSPIFAAHPAAHSRPNPYYIPTESVSSKYSLPISYWHCSTALYYSSCRATVNNIIYGPFFRWFGRPSSYWWAIYIVLHPPTIYWPEYPMNNKLLTL